MKVGGPLISQFNYLYNQAMPKQDQVTDTCVPTQWFGPMAKADFPQKTTLNTWWNESQDGRPLTNDGVSAFNYQPPPCQHFRSFDRVWGEGLFIGAAVLLTVLGSLWVLFKRTQIKAELAKEAALEDMGAMQDARVEAIPDEPVLAPTAVTPLPPKPASDTFDVDRLRSLADPAAASGRKRD